jgi:hypothetical protein
MILKTLPLPLGSVAGGVFAGVGRAVAVGVGDIRSGASVGGGAEIHEAPQLLRGRDCERHVVTITADVTDDPRIAASR